jgi:hypothetical protein
MANPLVSGAFGPFGASFGANQCSWGYELATISLAASPYDCQAKVAATPMQDEQNLLAERRPPVWEAVIFRVGRANSRNLDFDGQ